MKDRSKFLRTLHSRFEKNGFRVERERERESRDIRDDWPHYFGRIVQSENLKDSRSKVLENGRN